MIKKLILLIALITPLVCMAQKYGELTIGFEDKAIGINYIDIDNYFTVGAEAGKYEYFNTEVGHTKYKAGAALMFKKVLDGKNNVLANISLCYNDYNIIKNEVIKKMPEFSIELGARSNLSSRLYFGINIDVIQRTGGFSIGFIMFK